MVVHFEQASDTQGNIITKLEVTVTQVQKRSFGFWWSDITPFDLTVTGAFSGPRSPVNGGIPGSGYVQSGNPFTKTGVTLHSKVIHFLDISPATSPLYSIDNGQYSTVVTFTSVWNDQLFVNVNW